MKFSLTLHYYFQAQLGFDRENLQVHVSNRDKWCPEKHSTAFGNKKTLQLPLGDRMRLHEVQCLEIKQHFTVSKHLPSLSPKQQTWIAAGYKHVHRETKIPIATGPPWLITTTPRTKKTKDVTGAVEIRKDIKTKPEGLMLASGGGAGHYKT